MSYFNSKMCISYVYQNKTATTITSYSYLYCITRSVNSLEKIHHLRKTEVLCIPDVINGELVGYNFIYGLELQSPLNSYYNVNFIVCLEGCTLLDQCISFSFSKERRLCHLYDHDRFDEIGTRSNGSVGTDTLEHEDWLHYRNDKFTMC